MDGISRLPDDILGHILSFLPTKHAALTSVLSKRWLNLWKLVPNLDIDDTVFLHPEEDGNKGEREEIRQSFVQFVDNVLAMQGQSPINKYSLKCITGVHPDIVYRWILNVVQRGVSDLDLSTNFPMEVILTEMFLSTTLVKLKLRSEHNLLWLIKSSLPMLKSVDIDSESILFGGEFAKIIPSFPVLEELRIASMEWEESDVTVSSASLRKLTLHCTGYLGILNPKSVSFCTPNLLFLDYSDLVAGDYPLVNMGNLMEARINLIVTDYQIMLLRKSHNGFLLGHDEVHKIGNVVKLMNGIQNVQRLTLPSHTIKVLSLCTESIPVFNNLKFLRFSSVKNQGWQALPTLLRNCPHLESLIIESLLHKCGVACPCIVQGDEEGGLSLRSCRVNRLEIKGFRGTKKEMAMIEHFLDYFPCLKRLDVFIEENRKVSKRIKEKFKQYNEVWPSCSVQLR